MCTSDFKKKWVIFITLLSSFLFFYIFNNINLYLIKQFYLLQVTTKYSEINKIKLYYKYTRRNEIFDIASKFYKAKHK